MKSGFLVSQHSETKSNAATPNQFHIIIGESHSNGLAALTALEMLKNSKFIKQNLPTIKLCLEHTQTNFAEIKKYIAKRISLVNDLKQLASQNKTYTEIDQYMDSFTQGRYSADERKEHILRYLAHGDRFSAYQALCDYCDTLPIDVQPIDTTLGNVNTYANPQQAFTRSQFMAKKLQDYASQGYSTITLVGVAHVVDLHQLLQNTKNCFFVCIKDTGYQADVSLQQYHSSIAQEPYIQRTINSVKTNYFESSQSYLNQHAAEITVIEENDAAQAMKTVLQKIMETSLQTNTPLFRELLDKQWKKYPAEHLKGKRQEGHDVRFFTVAKNQITSAKTLSDNLKSAGADMIVNVKPDGSSASLIIDITASRLTF